MHIHLIALASILLATPMIVPTVTYSAATAPAQGRIVFVASLGANGASDIFTSDLAGETIVNLTNDDAPDSSPSWAPDGTQIVFASRRANNWDLYMIGANGTGLRRLTDDPAYDGDPSW